MKGVPATGFKPDAGASVRLVRVPGCCSWVSIGMVGRVRWHYGEDSRCPACPGATSVVMEVGGTCCVPLDCLAVIGGTATVKVDSKAPDALKHGDRVLCSSKRDHCGGGGTDIFAGKTCTVEDRDASGCGKGKCWVLTREGQRNCWPASCFEKIGESRKPKVGDVVDVSRRYGGGAQTSLTIRAAQECQCCDWRGTDGDGCDFTFKEEDIIRYHN